MAPPPPFLLLLALLLLSPAARSQRRRTPPLSADYYARSCPTFDQIVSRTTTDKQISSPTTAAGTLRLFFHDCFVSGCDASALVSPTRTGGPTEREADINLSLPGDAFDVVVRAKTELELICPGVVSCADILATAARNLVVMAGGPHYNVLLGRKDSLTSRASDVKGQLPKPTMTMAQMIQIFESKGFTVQEMVALSGAHTIGFSHCKEFKSNIYNYKGSQSGFHPAYYPQFAAGLRRACSNYTKNPDLSVVNDIMTPHTFDNMYYSNVKKGLGLLSSDLALSSDPRTRNYVDLYSKNQSAFFDAFAKAMEKLSVYGVKTGRQGEVRRRCDAFNN
ncbi:peroxidase superfamily protein [Striga asiatica]|uniref:Peroxidase n=1 Tax=Striga asiatica TaxID=4170 RepID=A0A5A7PTC9_STRAF|nr:peroxidase superfamily protein [Striga asiatica]